MAAKKNAIAKNDPARLGRERVGKLILEFALPAILGMAFNTLYNIIDTAFLQYSVGDSGAAVATLAFPVMTLLMGFSVLAGQGGNALAAIQLGEGHRARVEKTLGNTVLLLILLALFVAVIALVFMDPILAVLSTPAELYETTKDFVTIICCGFVLQSLGMGVNNFLRTAGQPNLAMITMALGTLMCMVFNYLFVMVMGWGVIGSAWATLVGQTFGMIPTMGYFIVVKSAPFRLHARNLAPEWGLMGRILMLGIASFIMQIGSTAVSLAFNLVIAKYSAIDGVSPDTALAALGIAMKSVSFAFTPIMGIVMAAQPLIGFSVGAKLWGRALKALKIATIAAMVVGFAFTLLATLFPEPIVSIFGIKDEGRELASSALTIVCLFLGPVGFQVVGSSYFQSSGQPMKAAVLEMTRQILILIPAYLIMPPVFMSIFGVSGLMGVACCLPFSDVVSILITVGFVVYEVRKVRRWRDEALAAGQPVYDLPDMPPVPAQD